jgi:hypothetical protein
MFANFSGTHSSATYVSLIDERDDKIYPVVKIGGRWMMARSLNYQKGLKWQEYANQPNTNNPCTDCIGSFWCPGSGGTSTLVACEVYGALYSWETSMLLVSKSETFHREFSYGRKDVSHGNINRSIGLSVRCIRD